MVAFPYRLVMFLYFYADCVMFWLVRFVCLTFVILLWSVAGGVDLIKRLVSHDENTKRPWNF